MKRKLLAYICVSAMVLSLAACGGTTTEPTASDTPQASQPESTPAESKTEEPAPTPAAPEKKEASVDFENGNLDFVQVYLAPANADDSEISIVDFNGSKALQVKNMGGKVPYVGIDAASLLGANIANVASIEMTMGTSYGDGSFSATSGEIVTWYGEKRDEQKYDWSVYMANQNPKVAVAKLAEGKSFVADQSNIIVVNLKADVGAEKDHGNATLYIDDIRFLDASGNLITADTSVAFNPPPKFADTGVDMTHLVYLKNPVELDGFAFSAGEWSQDGMEMSEDVIAALVPGSYVEIEYTSESGDIWIVMPDAQNGWSRVGNDGKSVKNLTHTLAQISYETILAVCGGSDASAFGPRLQCEADSEWEVFAVRVGQDSGVKDLKGGATDLEGFAVSGDGWAQAGIDFTEDIQGLLVPGAVVEVEYASESGEMWLVVTGAENGWTRISQGSSKNNGKVAQFTYEEIMEACGGSDASALGGQLQCEADSPWEVFSVKIGTYAGLVPLSNVTPLEGFAVSGDAWSQAGIDFTEDIQGLLVPGAVVEVQYESESGDVWLVVTGAVNGWIRVSQGSSKNNGKIAQFTYEEIMEACGGADASALGGQLQCESDTPWEVFSVSIGMTVQ